MAVDLKLKIILDYKKTSEYTKRFSSFYFLNMRAPNEAQISN